MRALVRLAALLTLASACVPTARSVSAQRGRLWAASGSPTVFSWVSTVEHRENREVEFGKDDAKVVDSTDDDPVRTAIYAIDPATRRETRLGQLDGAGGDPVYYDVPHSTLWVRGKEGELTALAPPGHAVRGPDHQHQLEAKSLEPPFVLASDSLGVVALHDLRTGSSVPLRAIDGSEITVTGEVVRFTAVSEQGESVRIQQIAIDASSGELQRLPDIDWATAPLPASSGTRLGIAVLRDGRHYAEVVRDATETRLLVFDLMSHGPPAQIALPVSASPDRPKAHLVVLAGDALVFGEAGEGEGLRCWTGAAIRVERQLVVPLPSDSCVVGASDVGPHRLLLLNDHGMAVIGPDGAVAKLDSVGAENLARGITIGATTRVVTHEDGELEQVDLATGERKVLGRGQTSDVLLAVDGSAARYARGSDKLVTLPLGGAAEAAVLALGEPTLSRLDRMPRDRTEFWLGIGGGVSTRRDGAGGLYAEVAHWVTDHWTWVARGKFRFEIDADNTDQQYLDAGGSFGYAWHRLPRLFSIFFEADVGASYAGTYVDNNRTDATFAPSLELHLGWQGKMAGIDVAAVVPSFIDIDRGVLFMVNAKIGFTENLH